MQHRWTQWWLGKGSAAWVCAALATACEPAPVIVSPDGGESGDGVEMAQGGAREPRLPPDAGPPTGPCSMGSAACETEHTPASSAQGCEAEGACEPTAQQGEGDSEDGEPVVTADVAPACEPEGLLRCGSLERTRERCRGGRWEAGPECETDEVCSNDADAGGGQCVTVSAVCQGHEGSRVCDGSGALYTCSDLGEIVDQLDCQSPELCEAGLTDGACPACVPETHQCDGYTLSRCDEAGSELDFVRICGSPALCDAEGGRCLSPACPDKGYTCMGNRLFQCNRDRTDYEQVETCQPGLCDAERGLCRACPLDERFCDGGVAVACRTDGTGYDRNPCGPTGYCEAGRCTPCQQSCNGRDAVRACRTDGTGYDIVPCGAASECVSGGYCMSCPDGQC